MHTSKNYKRNWKTHNLAIQNWIIWPQGSGIDLWMDYGGVIAHFDWKNFWAAAKTTSFFFLSWLANLLLIVYILFKRFKFAYLLTSLSCKVDVNSYWPLLTFCRLMVLCTTKIPLYSECCRVPGFVYWSSNTWVNLTFLRFPLTCRRSLAKTVANLGCNLSLSCRQ